MFDFPADKCRVILSGENPDYIHAVSANVSCLIQIFQIIADLFSCRATNTQRPTSLQRAQWHPLLGTCGRSFMTGSVELSSCCLTLWRMEWYMVYGLL